MIKFITVREDTPDEPIQEFTKKYFEVLFKTVKRIVPTIVPWFNSEVHEIENVSMDYSAPNIEIWIKTEEDSRLKLISSAWVARHTSEFYKEEWAALQRLESDFKEAMKEYIVDNDDDALITVEN